MSDDCIFCSIVAGEIPARTVYETDAVLAFLDANPLARGHTLVIPKSHARHVGDLDADLASELFDAVASLTSKIQAAVDADGANVGVNDGEGRPACFESGHPDCEGCAEDVRDGVVETW